MRRLGFALSMLLLVAAASWAYSINYRTKMALGRIDKLRAEIAAEREAAEVLRVEWAYLNAPDRLTRLVVLNNDRLGLVPMGPQHFDDVTSVPYPPPAPGRWLPGLPSEIVVAPGPEVEPLSPLLLPTSPMPPPRPASWRSP